MRIKWDVKCWEQYLVYSKNLVHVSNYYHVLQKKKQSQRSYRRPRVSHSSCSQVQWRAAWCLNCGSICYICNPYIFDLYSLNFLEGKCLHLFCVFLPDFSLIGLSPNLEPLYLEPGKPWILDPSFTSSMTLSKFI